MDLVQLFALNRTGFLSGYLGVKRTDNGFNTGMMSTEGWGNNTVIKHERIPDRSGNANTGARRVMGRVRQ